MDGGRNERNRGNRPQQPTFREQRHPLQSASRPRKDGVKEGHIRQRPSRKIPAQSVLGKPRLREGRGECETDGQIRHRRDRLAKKRCRLEPAGEHKNQRRNQQQQHHMQWKQASQPGPPELARFHGQPPAGIHVQPPQREARQQKKQAGRAVATLAYAVKPTGQHVEQRHGEGRWLGRGTASLMHRPKMEHIQMDRGQPAQTAESIERGSSSRIKRRGCGHPTRVSR